jgi:hypothetical protein
MFDD